MTRLQELIDIVRSGNHKKFYNSKEWRQCRANILQRDNYECQHCKRDGKVFTINDKSPNSHKSLEIDHVIELDDAPELCLSPSNLQTLCIRCHNAKHNRYQPAGKRKKKWDDEQW